MSKYGLMDPGTCLPVLESLCQVFDIENALEFGCGVWSTFSLTRNCKHLTSIENVEDWIKQVKQDYSHKGNLDIIHWKTPMNHYLNTTDNNYDLIFIDGEDRIDCLRDSFDRAPIIVCHDTHAQPIGWKDVHVPTNYKQLTYTACDPYLTTIFYQDNIDLKSILFDNTNYMFKHWCIDTNFWADLDICEWHRNQDPL